MISDCSYGCVRMNFAQCTLKIPEFNIGALVRPVSAYLASAVKPATGGTQLEASGRIDTMHIDQYTGANLAAVSTFHSSCISRTSVLDRVTTSKFCLHVAVHRLVLKKPISEDCLRTGNLSTVNCGRSSHAARWRRRRRRQQR